MAHINHIVTEVYETKSDDFMALVVFYEGRTRISYTKTAFADRQDAIQHAFKAAFEGRDYKVWSMATKRGEPGWRAYSLLS